MSIDAPFPWFGGKRRVAPLIWSRLGDVANYVEPFAGSLAVLLGRPHAPHIETVNDADGFVANFWRAVSYDAAAVASAADWPVNECDLHARHLWLVDRREELSSRLMADPDYYDAKIAGWWVWGVCLWIGSGWCSGDGPWRNVDGKLEKAEVRGVNKKLPAFGNNGRGVNKKLPHLGTNGTGAIASTDLHGWFSALQSRLRNVRVACGDWSRVMGPSVTWHHSSTKSNICGVVLDPPYDHDIRTSKLYAVDHPSISADVRRWCLEHGDRKNLRIALCGYEGEHDMPSSWECVAWKANGGYGNQSADNPNAHKERVWFSPHCLREQQGRLF